MSTPSLPSLRSTFLGELRIFVSQSFFVEGTPHGWRRLDRLDSGDFRGPRISAEVQPGGLDILLRTSDGTLRPDVRLVLMLDDGHPMLVQYRGVRHGSKDVMERIFKGENVDPSEYYLRTSLTFETASSKYDWLNRVVAVGVGRREPNGVVYEVHEIL